jgi:hypothetical protein
VAFAEFNISSKNNTNTTNANSTKSLLKKIAVSIAVFCDKYSHFKIMYSFYVQTAVTARAIHADLYDIAMMHSCCAPLR